MTFAHRSVEPREAKVAENLADMAKKIAAYRVRPSDPSLSSDSLCFLSKTMFKKTTLEDVIPKLHVAHCGRHQAQEVQTLLQEGEVVAY